MYDLCFSLSLSATPPGATLWEQTDSLKSLVSDEEKSTYVTVLRPKGALSV